MLGCTFLADEDAVVEFAEIEGLDLPSPARGHLCGLHLHYVEDGTISKFGLVPVEDYVPAVPAASTSVVDSRARYSPPRRG